MAATRLIPRKVEKVWGRCDLPAPFGDGSIGGALLGEIWFEDAEGQDHPLLVKYLFTSERLSIQVHPDDEAARRAGELRGKEEAWFIADAQPGASLGLGLTRRVSSEVLASAARDGSIESLVDWRPAFAGEVLYSPAGTIHALGAGLTVIEVQQNADVTYRLYDYGRPRELHIDDAVKVANRGPYQPLVRRYVRPDGREILAEGRAFVLERWRGPQVCMLRAPADSPLWLIPAEGIGGLDGHLLEMGGVWLVRGEAELSLETGSVLLVAYPGSKVVNGLFG
jgi:mannose-6-phosphate isomerase